MHRAATPHPGATRCRASQAAASRSCLRRLRSAKPAPSQRKAAAADAVIGLLYHCAAGAFVVFGAVDIFSLISPRALRALCWLL